MAELFNFPHNVEILGAFDVVASFDNGKLKISLLGPTRSKFVQARLFKFKTFHHNFCSRSGKERDEAGFLSIPLKAVEGRLKKCLRRFLEIPRCQE